MEPLISQGKWKQFLEEADEIAEDFRQKRRCFLGGGGFAVLVGLMIVVVVLIGSSNSVDSDDGPSISWGGFVLGAIQMIVGSGLMAYTQAIPEKVRDDISSLCDKTSSALPGVSMQVRTEKGYMCWQY